MIEILFVLFAILGGIVIATGGTLPVETEYFYKCYQRERQQMDICDKPIISFKDLEKYYWLNPRSWDVIETDFYYKNRSFKYYYCCKHMRDNQTISYGFKRKDYKSVKRFIRDNAISGQSRLDAKTKTNNIERLQDLLKDVQKDIDDIRAKQEEEIKQAKTMMQKIKLK